MRPSPDPSSPGPTSPKGDSSNQAVRPDGPKREASRRNQLRSRLASRRWNLWYVILGATNRPEILDVALPRAGRFDRQILVDRPDKQIIPRGIGGRAAESLVFGEISTGAADDLAEATNTARSMVTRYGMDELPMRKPGPRIAVGRAASQAAVREPTKSSREKADREAIEGAEDEGMTVRRR